MHFSTKNLKLREVADVMCHARNHYDYLIRRIKKNSDLVVRRSLANALLHDPTRDYWTEVKKIHKNKSSIQNKVDDKTGSVDIANIVFSIQVCLVNPHIYPSYKCVLRLQCAIFENIIITVCNIVIL